MVQDHDVAPGAGVRRQGSAAVYLLVGLLVGIAATYAWIHPRGTDEVSVDVVTGTAEMSGSRDGIVLRVDEGRLNTDYTMLDPNGIGLDLRTGAECLEPLVETPVEVGLVFTEVKPGQPGRALVAWVTCTA